MSVIQKRENALGSMRKSIDSRARREEINAIRIFQTGAGIQLGFVPMDGKFIEPTIDLNRKTALDLALAILCNLPGNDLMMSEALKKLTDTVQSWQESLRNLPRGDSSEAALKKLANTVQSWQENTP